MSVFAGTPSDDVPEVLAIGRTDVTTLFVSLAARERNGRDLDYLTWHALDHQAEQHRLHALRGSWRLISTPACRAVRAASVEPYDAVDHVMSYLFADAAAVPPFRALGQALWDAGRMPLRLPSVETGVWTLDGAAAAPRVLAGADVIPWRPARGVYLVLEEGRSPAAGLAEAAGVAGAWWWADGDGGRQLTYCYLDDDPVAAAGALRPLLDARWAAGDVTPLLAAPFHTVAPYAWDRHLP